MGRPRRVDSAGTWYHVYNRGVDRNAIFFDVRDRVEFERLLGVINERFGVRVHAFCQMTNHYHLLLECPDGGLSDAMHLFTSVFVRHVNERRGRDGPLFRSRFSAKPVTDDAYLLRLVRYIHRNPLAFATVEQLRSYTWSSFRVYLGRHRAPRWMSTAPILAMFDDVSSFDRFTTADTVSPICPRVGVAAWQDAIELIVDERLDAVPRQGADRTVAALLLDCVDGVSRDDVATFLDFPSPGAERTARSRARARLAAQPELADVLAGVVDLVA